MHQKSQFRGVLLVQVQQFETGTRYGLDKKIEAIARKFGDLIPMFVGVTAEKLVGGPICRGGG